MRERWSTVIPQRTKKRVGVDLIARTSQQPAGIIAADIISVRCDRAAVVEDVFPRCAGVEDCISSFNCRRSELIRHVIDATAENCRVAAESAVCKLHYPGIVRNAAAGVVGRVAADGAVDDAYETILAEDPATSLC